MEPVAYIDRITEQYSKLGYKPYQWVVNRVPPPWRKPEKPLDRSRLVLIASGGIYVSGQVAFHHRDDVGLRTIPTGVGTADLRISHFAYDATDARSDPNVVFPIDTLRDLVKEGFLGQLAEHAFTFMGGIYSSRKVSTELAPELTKRVLAERADLALLVPV